MHDWQTFWWYSDAHSYRRTMVYPPSGSGHRIQHNWFFKFLLKIWCWEFVCLPFPFDLIHNILVKRIYARTVKLEGPCSSFRPLVWYSDTMPSSQMSTSVYYQAFDLVTEVLSFAKSVKKCVVCMSGFPLIVNYLS